ncbi:hypothetical protein A2707_03545 [Candidatus Saccharibacteria bacterium RIFCSPHIGHO2_01_FULL_45_15]|nr:MAG: hypothetical protein A2707_03545 [Candidatus Saccharibacteria bacterium RIFCSPHIGHO2_01_FULL_45_15]OGL32429.1 MAG: hypothetical protein A3E76_00020 [Candidatus Saccharibacteria bacterium RIFCSPHIGHO2_12_FULL_44_22]
MESKTSFTTILFDIGGVVIEQSDNSEAIRQRLGLNEEVFRTIWSDAVKKFGSGMMTQDEFWQYFADNGAETVDSSEDLFGTTLEQQLELYPSMIDYIKKLGEYGYRCAVLSDTNEAHANILRQHGVYDPFNDQVFLSHEIAARKPAAKAFTYALEHLNITDPSSVLFVDDRMRNILAAHVLGMQTLHVPGTEKENLALLQNAIAHNQIPAN